MSAARRLAALVGGAVVVALALVSSTAVGGGVPVAGRPQQVIAPADTDSVRVQPGDSLRLDSLRLDSLRADTTLADSTLVDSTGADTTQADTTHYELVDRYLKGLLRDRPSAFVTPRKHRPMLPPLGPFWTHSVEMDSTDDRFTVREQVGKWDVRTPLRLEYDQYRAARLDESLDDNWDTLIEQLKRRKQQRSRGLGFSVQVPGGQNSAFSSIFGANTVDLRINGNADINAGFDYRKSDQQALVTGKNTQLDPQFKQDLSLSIGGTIGDKMRVEVSWDTQNQFDYENQLKLVYTGYEDEIIQKIEAGNVFLNTPSSLIRGAQSLFGVKSEFQVGNLHLTTVASQQEGQANTLSLEGGSETTTFDAKPTEYDARRHFFISFYFRNRWEDALSDPPNVRVANNFERVTDIEVWKLQTSASPEDDNVRSAVALVDLGESPDILTQADAYTSTTAADLPDNDNDQYADDEVDTILRDGNKSLDNFLTAKGLTASDSQQGQFKRLVRGRDYTLDETLGYITLQTAISENEALAVSYRYIANGTRSVGDLSTQTGGTTGGQTSDRLVLKLLRPTNLSQPATDGEFNPAVWYLEMRNIYRLGAGLNPNDFTLNIEYQPSGKPATRIVPEVTGQETLLTSLGLDRLNDDLAPRPDTKFDFLTNYTIEPSDGLLIFPYLQPFGSRIEQLIDARGGSEESKQQKRDTYVFKTLYTEKKENAARDTQFDVYRINGEFKGSSVQAFYDLKAYAGIVPGSVRVTAGGTTLSEGADYTVDYNGTGSVNITNTAYLTAGREIDISYESNSFFNIQKKTLVGARADYGFSEKVGLGATLMRLSERSPIDKFRIGEEPISNTIWGMDGKIDLQPRWLTRAVDALPFIQTKAPSTVSLSGEFAQLRPGASQTTAFNRSRKSLKNTGEDFHQDELNGISFIDDFEGFENTFTLKQPGTWRLAAAPDSIWFDAPGAAVPPDLATRGDSLRTNWRAGFTWYTLNENILADLSDKVSVFDQESIRTLQVTEVFPNRDVSAGQSVNRLQTLDFYFNPRVRGPYNYTTELGDFLDHPKQTWGGITQPLPEGFRDFSLKNIEFIEFVFRPFAENEARDAGADAKLYVDLGKISEDVLPDERLNNEDGLSFGDTGSGFSEWGRLTRGTQNSSVDIDEATRRTEDLGLDGLVSYDTADYDPSASEFDHFSKFLNSFDQGRMASDPRYRAEVKRAQIDPSGDDYHFYDNDRFYGDPDLFPPELGYVGRTPLQMRFLHWFPGQELNAFNTQNELASNTSSKRGNSSIPDTEDLNHNSTVDTENSYFEYELDLSLARLKALGKPDEVNDFVVTEITDEDGKGTGWYQIRIPIKDWSRRVGSIQNFSNVESMRLWTTGHEVPITMRFATLELVGSQWQKSDQLASERERPGEGEANGAELSISSINNEENPNVYKSPNGTIITQTRLTTGTLQKSREQAMVLRVENLLPGRQRGIFKTQTEGIDLLKYSNLRMFAHLDGTLASGLSLIDLPPDEQRKKVKLFLRLGSNETNDYYEYEAPLSPSPLGVDVKTDMLWQTKIAVGDHNADLNSVNIELAALNQLKVARDEATAVTDSVFWSDDPRAAGIDPERFAPPGTRLAIKGNPSLGTVNTLVLGVRNAADSTMGGAPNLNPDDILGDVSVWVNELRVSGYDQQTGFAALANANIQLADFASVKASFNTQQDGFGSLTSSLGERDQTAQLNWTVTSDVNLDKFLPERFGWSIFASGQMQASTSTPRFSPQRGDVRLDDIVQLIRQNDSLTNEERAREEENAIESAQTYTKRRSITTRLAKQGSRSPLLRYTVDGLSLNYSYSESQGRNPSQQVNDSWNWTTNLSYRFNLQRPKTVRPFGFLDGIPVLGALGGLDFNYLPQSLSASASATRNFTVVKDRPVAGRAVSTLPERVEFRFREQHQFGHTRNFDLQYNPFQFLNLSWRSDTNQSFSALGVDTLKTVILADSVGNIVNVIPNKGLNQVEVPDSLQGFQEDRLHVRDGFTVFGDAFSGDDRLRTDRYASRFSGTFRPNINKVKALDFISLQDVTYGAQYSWQNGSVGRNTGANVSNQVDIRGGITIQPQELWRKFGFYRKMEEAERQAQQDREQARREREREKEQRAEQERRRRELEEAGELPKEEAPKKEVPEKEVPEKEAPEKGAEGEGAQGDAAGEEGAEAEKSGGGFPLPLPNVKALFRKTFLAITGIRDLTVSYTGSRGASSSNVGQPIRNAAGDIIGANVAYSLLDAFRGNRPTPSVAYRFGLSRDPGLSTGQRVVDPSLQVTDVFSNTNRMTGRTMLTPTRSLQITLSWNLEWANDDNVTYRTDDENPNVVLRNQTSNGTEKASVWSFGADYLSLFKRQLDTYDADLAAFTEGETLGDENGDGRVVLTNRTVVDDFLSSFLKGPGTIDRRGLLPFPMPNWNVRYDGVSNWPLLRRFVQSASLRHAYQADYSTDFKTNVAALSGDNQSTFTLGANRIAFTLPIEEVGGIRINERWAPLIGLDLTWKNRLTTNVSWEKSRAFSLSTSNFDLSENNQSTLTFTGSFRKQGIRLPFFAHRLNNNISFTLTLSRAQVTDQRFLLKTGLLSAINDPDFRIADAASGDNISVVTASIRTTVSPQISYQFSNTVTGSFQLKYEQFNSEDSRQPSFTNVNGGFTFRVNING